MQENINLLSNQLHAVELDSSLYADFNSINWLNLDTGLYAFSISGAEIVNPPSDDFSNNAIYTILIKVNTGDYGGGAQLNHRVTVGELSLDMTGGSYERTSLKSLGNMVTIGWKRLDNVDIIDVSKVLYKDNPLNLTLDDVGSYVNKYNTVFDNPIVVVGNSSINITELIINNLNNRVSLFSAVKTVSGMGSILQKKEFINGTDCYLIEDLIHMHYQDIDIRIKIEIEGIADAGGSDTISLEIVDKFSNSVFDRVIYEKDIIDDTGYIPNFKLKTGDIYGGGYSTNGFYLRLNNSSNDINILSIEEFYIVS